MATPGYQSQRAHNDIQHTAPAAVVPALAARIQQLLWHYSAEIQVPFD